MYWVGFKRILCPNNFSLSPLQIDDIYHSIAHLYLLYYIIYTILGTYDGMTFIQDDWLLFSFFLFFFLFNKIHRKPSHTTYNISVNSVKKNQNENGSECDLCPRPMFSFFIEYMSMSINKIESFWLGRFASFICARIFFFSFLLRFSMVFYWFICLNITQYILLYEMK